jgi:probable H4MPT-linked C1 transfer pathway protein
MSTLALDIGGANLKAAHSGGGAWSRPFALWRAPDRLTQQLQQVIAAAPTFDRLAVTMTAELCDCFETKQQGVLHVLDAVAAVAAGRPIFAWTLDGRFVSIDQARQQPLRCAASNWHALATWTAAAFAEGLSLLFDTGSTTTDVIPLRDGRVAARGETDMQRLACGELVYLGAERTPLMALGPTVRWRDGEHRVMAELFATTADVYLLTGHTAPQPRRTDTADGRPMTVQGAALRVARMIGGDLETMSIDQAVVVAAAFAETVRARLVAAIGSVLDHETPDRVIVAGSGAFVAQDAVRSALPSVSIVHLADSFGEENAQAACAYALTQLLTKAESPWHRPVST